MLHLKKKKYSLKSVQLSKIVKLLIQDLPCPYFHALKNEINHDVTHRLKHVRMLI